MIKENKIIPQKKYGRFFLANEAPEDDDFPDSQVKFNTKIVSVKPHNRRKNYFDDDFQDDIDDITGDETIDDTDATDDAGFDNPAPEVTDPDYDPNSEPDGNEPLYDNSDDEFNNDDLEQQVDDVNDEINNDPNQSPLPDTTDPNSDITGGDTYDDGNGPVLDDNPTDDTSDLYNTTDDTTAPLDQSQDPNAQPKGPGIEYDSTRKYVLFNKYLDLINAIDSYIEKFDNIALDDFNTNLLYKNTSDKLNEIKNLLNDFLLIKFDLSSYVQSLLFYQNALVLVSKLFDATNQALKRIKSK